MTMTRLSPSAVFGYVTALKAGQVATYKEVALAACGNPRAARACAGVLARNTDPRVPCHRVVGTDGRVAGYNGLRTGGVPGSDAKRELLRREGVPFTAGGKVDWRTLRAGR